MDMKLLFSGLGIMGGIYRVRDHMPGTWVVLWHMALNNSAGAGDLSRGGQVSGEDTLLAI